MAGSSDRKRQYGSGDAGAAAEPPTKVRLNSDGASKGSASFKAPEATEVLEIASAQNLYKSNLFRLQLGEVIKAMVPQKTPKGLDAVLQTLRNALENLDSRQIPETLADEFPDLFFHDAVHPDHFHFEAPRRIDLVGSFHLGTCTDSVFSADVAMEMPSAAFKSKDFLNFRYFDKRTAYAGEVYRQLQGQDIASRYMPGLGVALEVLVGNLHGDCFRPCVVIQPQDDGGAPPWRIRLLPVWNPELFPAQKLAPDRNLVRSIGVCGSDGAVVDTQAVLAIPTANYNSCLLEDGRMRQHAELLHSAFGRIPALREAVILLKRWAMARGFLFQEGHGVPCGPVTGFGLSILAAHAATTSSISPSQTSYFQLFKLALTVLVSTDWAKQKLIFGKAPATPLSGSEVKSCQVHFYDAEGLFNFFWRIGPFISEIQMEADRSLKILDAESDPFDAVFGLDASSPSLQWDLTVQSPPLGRDALFPARAGNATSKVLAGETPPVDAPLLQCLAARMRSILREGLGDRCVHVAMRMATGPEGVRVAIGMKLDASNLARFLDRGPSAESVEATSFRALWGPQKAELRRFKDGSVLECAAWAKPPPDRHVESRKQPAVVSQIVRHLLDRHFSDVKGELFDVISGPVGFVSNLRQEGRRLWVEFEAFRAHLCQLSSLPLVIKDVHPVDASFSYTALAPSVAPANPDGVARTLHNAVVEFESSGRWPEDPLAARKVATALLLQIKEELQNDLGLESDIASSGGFLDVRFPEFAFRIQIFHSRELFEIAHCVTNFQIPIATSIPPEESLERLRSVWWRPRIRAALHAMALKQPAFAGTSRLVQRWFRSQLLAGCEDFAETLVAAVFLQPLPFEAPTSPHVGLCRVCWLLDTYDWAREPLIIDFDGKMTSEERLRMRQSFERSRTGAGESASQSMWVVTRYDPHCLLLPRPAGTASSWLRRRARIALAVLHGQVAVDRSRIDIGRWDALFAVDHSSFDFVIQLQMPSTGPEKAAKGGNLASSKALVSRQAVETLVTKIRSNLGCVCIVFYDTDSRTVALKWRPTAFLPQYQNFLMGAVPHTMIQRDDRPPVCVPNVLCLFSIVLSLADGLALRASVVGTRGGSLAFKR